MALPRAAWLSLAVSAPSVSGGLIYIVGEAVFAHELTSGELAWRTSFSPANRAQDGGTWIETSPAVAYDKVFVVGDNHVAAFDAKAGQQIWKTPLPYVGGTTVAIADGTLLVDG